MVIRHIWKRVLILAASLTLAMSAGAQQGDKEGEDQAARVPRERIPPAPALTPEASLKAMKVPPGFRVELVAAEPMVDTPVAMTFDADGRVWVVEMRGLMPNIEGKGEQEIPGRIVVLEDVDRDGKMDRRTVFLDGLVMPRAVALAGDGVLVGEPPHLWYWRDTDGDGKADEKTEVASDYGSQANPEHTSNGLVWAMDNWYYNLYHTYRYRQRNGRWERQAIPNRVQWGLSQDHYGRLFFTSNSDQLRADLFPPHYVGNRPKVKLPGLNHQVVKDQSVWPIRVNPGVNRGYRDGTLREDGRLARFTAACGTGVYRGHLFPSEYDNNVFVCEPSGNLIRRNVLSEERGIVSGENPHGDSEFLASTDERFRPVNLHTGPDGALYVVDVYHGILQHRIYLTTYLRGQIEDRGLDKPPHMGRIYRIVPEGVSPDAPPHLSAASPEQWVDYLAHPNGWIRDTAQRLLVERGQLDVQEALSTMVRTHANPRTRLHALWALEGLGAADIGTLQSALQDSHPKIRRAGLRVAEEKLLVVGNASDVVSLKKQFMDLATDPEEEVRVQLALSLGAIAYDPNVKQALSALQEDTQPKAVRDAAAFSLEVREPPKPAGNVARVKPLSKEHQVWFDQGKEVFEITCIACHQAHGLGQEGLAPPLVGSEWVGYSADRLARIVLHGLRGPIEVLGETYEIDMPALEVLSDEQIASVLTFIRHEWGHDYEPISPEAVERVRAATVGRGEAWSAEELLKIP